MNVEASFSEAPTVLAVVVAHNPGGWFEETLESLLYQDYQHLNVVVVDTADDDLDATKTDAGQELTEQEVVDAVASTDAVSVCGLEERVRAVIRDAAIIKAPGVKGFSEAANTILATDLHASYLLLCHDDVALDPDTVTRLVTQARIENADVVAPKLVHWDVPTRIQSVGFEVDRFGVKSDIAAVNELDQEQHDIVRDVFAVSTAVMLIDRDLFVRLGGCDPELRFQGEDVDLCWRARMAGAHIITAGDARARLREHSVEQSRITDRDLAGLLSRENLRCMFVNHGRISLLFFVPSAFLISISESALAVVTGRLRYTRDVILGWWWNLVRLDTILARRSANTKIRKVRPADVTALQYFGSVRLAAFGRHRFDNDGLESTGGFFNSAGHWLLNSLSVARARTVGSAWVLVVLFVLFGSRSLISSGVAAVGDFVLFPSSAAELLKSWWSGWSESDTGAPYPNLGGLFWLGLFGGLLELVGGSMDSVRTLWVLGPIFVGLVGAYRMMHTVGSYRAQIGALVAYCLIPLASSSVASGSIVGLVAYAAAPWLLATVLKALGVPPFGIVNDTEGTHTHKWRDGLLRDVLMLGVIAGLAALFAPPVAGLTFVIAAGLIISSLMVGPLNGMLRIVAVTVASLPITLLIVLPLVVDLLFMGMSWSLVTDGRDGSAMSVSLAELLRFAVGPEDGSLSLWFLFAPMTLPLLLGQSWRFEHAVRLWMVAITSWGIALISQHGFLSFGLPDVHLLLAPAAAAASALCGLAVLSVERDLRSSRFDYRQVLVPVATIAAIILLIGTIGILKDGRWGQPIKDHRSILSFEPEVSGHYRVLWIGAPEFLSVEGRRLDENLAWAATPGDSVTITDRSLVADPGQANLIEIALKGMASGRTSRGGRLLADLGIRYVVLVHRLAPAPFSTEHQAMVVDVKWVDALESQLDLQLVQGVNSALTLFDNTSWVSTDSRDQVSLDTSITDLSEWHVNTLSADTVVLSYPSPAYPSPLWRYFSRATSLFVLLILALAWLRRRMSTPYSDTYRGEW